MTSLFPKNFFRIQENLKVLELELQETRDDLGICKSLLERKTEELKNTRDKLKEVELERDQKSYLVKKHTKTESKLTGEAGELLNTVVDATSNLEKMYRKLDRKT